MKRNSFTGFLEGVVVLVGAGWLLSMTTSVEVDNPTDILPSWLVVVLLVGGVYFIVACWGGRVNFPALLVVGLLVAGLIWLNGTDAMPSGGVNPCPGDEVVIAIGGQCYGMDADANRAWLEGKVGR